MPLMREQNDVLRGLFTQSELAALYAAIDRIDNVFESLGQRRRVYGGDVDLRDVVDVRSGGSVVDARSRIHRKK